MFTFFDTRVYALYDTNEWDLTFYSDPTPFAPICICHYHNHYHNHHHKYYHKYYHKYNHYCCNTDRLA